MATVQGLEGIDTTVQQTHKWLGEIAEEYHGNKGDALSILRAFLHTLREHLTVEESADLSAQLPLLIRGIYYEGWDPSKSMIKERSREAFIERFMSEAAIRDMDAPMAISAVMRVLQEHISEGEIQDIIASLPAQVRQLLV